MQAHREHRGVPVDPLPVQLVEGRAEILGECYRRGEAVRRTEFHVVAVERVGDDEVAFAPLQLQPVRDVVVVGIRVVKQATAFDREPARVRAHPAAVEADRRLARLLADGLLRLQNVLALDVLGDGGIVEPAPVVARDLETLPGAIAADLRIERERLAHTENGRRHVQLLEEPQDAPDAGASAVVVKALGVVVALALARLDAANLMDVALGGGIAVLDRPFRALLVVEDEAQRERAPVTPGRARARAAVTNEVAIVHGAHGLEFLDD